MEIVWIVLVGVGFFIGTKVGKDAGKEEAYSAQNAQIQSSLFSHGDFHRTYGIRGAYGLDGHETRGGTKFFIVHAEEFNTRFSQHN